MRLNFVMSGVATGLRRNLSMTIALVLSTAISLSFLIAALTVSTFIGDFRNQYENKLSVTIYLCPSVTLDTDPTCKARYTDAEQQHDRCSRAAPCGACGASLEGAHAIGARRRPATTTRRHEKTPRAPARARLPLLRLRPGGVGLDGATRGADHYSTDFAARCLPSKTTRGRMPPKGTIG